MTAVLFDLDGTLIDSLPNITDAVNAVLAERSMAPLPREVVAGFIGLGEQVLVDRLIAATALGPDERDWVMSTFMDRYKEEAGKTRCFHNVRRCLDTLASEGFALGLITNKPRAPLDATLDSAGISTCFKIVVAGDDLPKRKPDPLPIRHAIETLGASKAIYVGDSETDAETALNAGVPFVLFTEGIHHGSVHDMPHEVAFSDFGMLPAIIRRMAEA